MNIFQRQIELLGKVISICDQTTNPYRETELENNTRFFAVNMLERLRKRSISLVPLLEAYPENNDTEYGIGLLLRNQATDMLSALYVYTLLIHGEQDNLEKFLTNFLNDGLRSTKTYMQSVNENFSHKFPPDEAERIIKELNEKIAQLNQEPIKGIYNKLLLYMSGNEEEDNYRKDLAHQAYDTYMLFSKVEHFGMESIKLTTMPFSTKINSFQIKIYFILFLMDMLHRIIYIENETEFNMQRHIVAKSLLEESMEDFKLKSNEEKN